MSITSILSAVGHGFEVFFTDATKVAKLAEPIVDIAFPGIATLYNLTVTAAINAENAAIAAGEQTGTGAQKLALVIAAIENDFAVYAATAGISYNSATITSWVNAVIATLNSIPSSSTATAASPTSASTGTTATGAAAPSVATQAASGSLL